ncbi:MAG: polysaccharide deacetylase family protein [bacterium]
MKVACITLDTEPDLGSDRCDIELFRNPDQLGPFQEVIREHGVKLTGFLVTKIIRENPKAIERATAALPIRFESHSHHHNQRDTDSERELDDTMEAYAGFFGRPPRGYRAPNGLITPRGLVRLAARGFVYDSSIFPSCRFDAYAYNNLGLPVVPYAYSTAAGELIELPLAVVKGVRLIVSLSYMKLLGWRFYEVLIRRLGLPDILVIDTHPYDFFVGGHLHRVSGWKRWAHARNAENALGIFDRLLQVLKLSGYTFLYVDELLPLLGKKGMKRIDLSGA